METALQRIGYIEKFGIFAKQYGVILGMNAMLMHEFQGMRKANQLGLRLAPEAVALKFVTDQYGVLIFRIPGIDVDTLVPWRLRDPSRDKARERWMRGATSEFLRTKHTTSYAGDWDSLFCDPGSAKMFLLDWKPLRPGRLLDEDRH